MDPMPIPTEPLTFLQGDAMTTCGDAGSKGGMGAHLYFITR